MAAFGRGRRPSSIYETDTTAARAARRHRDGSRLRTVVSAAAAAVVVLGGGSYWLLHGGGSNDVSKANPQHSVLASGPQLNDPSKSHIDVLIDGWSYKTLGSTAVFAQVSGAPEQVDFEPATASDVADLLSSTPDLVAEAMSRMVTDDPTLTCTASGCSTAAGPVSANLLLNPADVPGLGSSYAGYGISHGLYLAEVPTGGSTGSVTLSADGYQSLDVAATTPVSDDGTKLAATPDNGWLQSRFLLGAGLGRLFPLDAQWQGSNPADPTRYDVTPATAPPANALTTVQAKNPAGVATSGLGTAFAPASSWSGGHLTYATSPTTGCGPEALCVPEVVSPSVVRDVRDYAKVCSPVTSDTGVAALDDTLVRVTLPAPTHQFGLGDPTARWGKTPTVVSGSQEIHLGVLGLYDGPDLGVRETGGTVGSGAEAPITVADALAGVRFDGVHWKRC